VRHFNYGRSGKLQLKKGHGRKDILLLSYFKCLHLSISHVDYSRPDHQFTYYFIIKMVLRYNMCYGQMGGYCSVTSTRELEIGLAGLLG
jgi:hypothetical protein